MFLLWLGGILDWKPSCQCPLLSSRGWDLAALFPSWQLGPLFPVSSFLLPFDRLQVDSHIFFFLFSFFFFLFNNMLFFSGLWPDLWGKIVGSGDRIGKGLQENLWSFLPPLDFPRWWLSQRCSREPARNCCTVFLWCPPNPSPQKPRSFVGETKIEEKTQNHLFSKVTRGGQQMYLGGTSSQSPPLQSLPGSFQRFSTKNPSLLQPSSSLLSWWGW